MRLIAFLFATMFLPVLVFAHAQEEHISVVSPTGEIEGEEVSLEVRVQTEQPATAFSIHLLYDESTVDVLEIIPNTDEFPYWFTQTVEDGKIILEAGVPAPGFSGEDIAATVVVVAEGARYPLLTVEDTESLLLDAEDRNILTLQEFEPQVITAQAATATAGTTGLATVLGFLLLGGLAVGGLVLLRARSN